MKTVEGDIVDLALNGHFDTIIHGCNCFHTMGAGLAKTIREAFPEAYAVDMKTVKGDRAKLGTLSIARAHRQGRVITIVNAYTQFDWRGRAVKADYEAIRRAMREVGGVFRDSRVGYPQIGAGLAGGRWEVIAPIIEEELNGLQHTLVLYKPSPSVKFQQKPGI